MSDLIDRQFEEIVVEYPNPDLCSYPEYKGKPYFSIHYTENGKDFIGYGTYNPEVLSNYLKEYFMPSAQSKIIRCKDCKWRCELRDDSAFYPYCEKLFNMGIYVFDEMMKDDDFCSLAERREE